MRNALKSRVFLSWFLSYLFILIMPMLMGQFVYTKSLDTINEEVSNVNAIALNQLKSVLDGSFSNLDKIVGNLTLHQDVRTLMSRGKPLESKDMLTLLRVQNSLSMYLMTDAILEDIYLYFDNQKFMLTSAYKYNADELEKVCASAFGLSYEEIQAMSRTRSGERLRFITQELPDGRQKSRVLFISPVFGFHYTKPSGLLIIQINENRLRRLIQDTESLNNSDVIIINSLNESFGTSPLVEAERLQGYEEIALAPHTFGEMVAGEDTTVAHVGSDVMRVQFLSLISTEIYHQKASEIRQIVTWYVLICLVIGVTLACLFAKWNYSPLDKLKKMLYNNVETQKGTSNEYVFLEQTIGHLLEEKNEIKTIRERQLSAQASNLLAQLLRGRGHDGELAELLMSHGITFTSQYFLAAAVRIETASDKLAPECLEHGDSYAFICKVIKEVGEGILREKYTAYTAENDGMLVFIVNGDSEPEQDFSDQTAQAAERLIDFIQQSFGMELSACISGVHTSQWALTEAYSEILLAYGYRGFMEDKEKVLRFDTINKRMISTDFDFFSLTQQHFFANCIASRDFEGARKILDNVLEKGLHSVHSIQLMRIRVFSFASILMNAVTEGCDGTDPAILKLVDLFERLLSAKSVTELQEDTDSLMRSVVKYLEALDGMRVPDCVKEAEAYVQAHYCEPGMSVAAVADHLQVSVSHLSRVYKRYKGIGLLDLIHLKRLQKAKECMGGMNLAQTAECVGYSDSKALIRAFKRYEGTTPGRFKNGEGGARPE